MPKSATNRSGTSRWVMGFQGSRSKTAINQFAVDHTASRQHLTIHWLHILMQYIFAVTEFESNCDLKANLDDLTFGEVLATVVSTSIESDKKREGLRSSAQHLNLSVQVFASIVIHEKGQSTRFAIVLKPIVKRSNVRSAA
jgi:hypothetical protein